MTSGYRSQSYQDHLREVWDKYHLINSWNEAECAAVKQNINDEWGTHILVYQPAETSNHTAGNAFDASWTPLGLDIDALAGQCSLTRPVANDPVHFER